MSLRDSGTKNRKFLRILLTCVLAFALVVMTGVVAFAEEAEPETESSAAQTEESVTTEENGESTGDDSGSGWKETFDSSYPNLDPEAPIGEKFMYGLQVTGIGMAVVFLVLILIMAILYVFKLFATSGAKKPVEASQSASTSAPAAASVAPVADDEQLIVAIATAAIAAERGESECAFKVISITKLQ